MRYRSAQSAVAIVLSTCFFVAATPLRADPTAAGTPPQPIWNPGELVVGFDRSAAMDFTALKSRLPQARNWRILRHCSDAKDDPRAENPLTRVRVIRLHPDDDVLASAERVRAIPGVKFAHPNYVIAPAEAPDDPYYASHQYAPQSIGAEQAWRFTSGRADVIVAVIDSGLRSDHEDLQGAAWTNDADPVNNLDDDANGFIDDLHGWDFINGDNNPADSNGHGTHVAGIIAARTGNGVGIAGLCNATIMPLQVFQNGTGTWTALAEAVVYAVDNGAAAINFSGGGYGGDELVAQVVQYAWRNNVPVVAAAGNHGSSTPYYPAAYPETIAVAAVGPDDAWFTHSGRGLHMDIAAPGVNIWSTYAGASNDYRYATGTSMAAAHVTGLVALMLGTNPNLDVEEIRTLLQTTSVDLGPTGFDQQFGFGRIDAAAAVAAVPLDVEPPYIVHDGGAITRPCSGCIDPCAESTNGAALDLGIDSIVVTFNESVRDVAAPAMQQLSPESFIVTCTADPCPQVALVDARNNPTVELQLTAPIPAGAWTTIIADVEDRSANRIREQGDDEPDRIDLGFLPGDVNGSAVVDPLDLLMFKRLVNGLAGNPLSAIDRADMNRNGSVEPADLLLFRQLIRGEGTATTPWAGRRLGDRP